MKLPVVKLPGSDHLYDLAAFAATVTVAAWQEWAASELLWSLWISSLLVGYSFIVVTLFVGNEEGPLSSVGQLITTLLVLGFFTLHFVAFHWGHAFFLDQFFPLVPDSAGLFGQGGPVWWVTVVATAVERYWPFLLATVVSRRHGFLRSVDAVPNRDETLRQPYRNVVRMHLLIFVYVGMWMAGITGWFLYAVLFFYFFPLNTLRALFHGEAAGGG